VDDDNTNANPTVEETTLEPQTYKEGQLW